MREISAFPLRPLAFALTLGLAGCVTEADTLAPSSATTPYRPPVEEGGTLAPAPSAKNFTLPVNPAIPVALAKPEIQQSHVYNLAELIDMAELNNPVTRSAWQKAREAAQAVGIAQATFLPVLTADVLVGYQNASQPVPGYSISSTTQAGTSVLDAAGLPTTIGIPAGTVITESRQVVPSATVKWLLFDFGGRKADLEAARQITVAAGVTFNGTHQKLIYDVSRTFFAYTSAREQVRIGEATLANANLTHEAAKARLANGVATTIEEAQARQQVAQARLGLVQAQGNERDTYHALLDAMGVSPSLTIKVQDVSSRPLPSLPKGQLEKMIDTALRRRPDVQAAFARNKASEEQIARATSDFLPQVGLVATTNRYIGSATFTDTRLGSVNGAPLNSQNSSAMLGVTMPIYDGGLRESRLKAAQAQAAASAEDLTQIQGAAARQIVTSYDTLRTSLEAFSAASELTRASELTHKAALEYYSKGLGTLTDLTAAHSGLLQARLARAKAHSDALIASATLAFATGAIVHPGAR